MKKDLLWILAALMLAMATVSCSSDDKESNELTGPRVENGKVVMGHGASRTEIVYVPVSIDKLPEWLQEWILSEGPQGVGYVVCEGTWDGQHAYYYYSPFMSSLGSLQFDDGYYISCNWFEGEFKEKGGGWEAWTCIAFYDPLTDDEENSDE